MLRSITVTLAATVAVAFAACGSGEHTASSSVTPESAKTVVERAAQLELTPSRSPTTRAGRACGRPTATPPPR